MVNVCAFGLHPPASDHCLRSISTAIDEFRLSPSELSSQGHTLGPPSPGLPHSRLQKLHSTTLPHKAPLSPFLPEALQAPQPRSLSFLFIIPNTQTRLRLEQGHPLLVTRVLYLHLICTHSRHLSKCRDGHRPFATHSPREGDVPASTFQLPTLRFAP